MLRNAKFSIGSTVRHRKHGFRGVVFDVDPIFSHTDEWYEAIPAHRRPAKDQPYYHLFAEAEDKTSYIAYVSEQNLLPDGAEEPVGHPSIPDFFDGMDASGCYRLRSDLLN